MGGRRTFDEFVSVEGRRGETAGEGGGRIGEGVDEGRRDWKFGGVRRSGREGISRGRSVEGVVGRSVVRGGFARGTSVGAGDGSWTSLGVGESFDLVGGESREVVAWPRSVGGDLGTKKKRSKTRDANGKRRTETRHTEAPTGVAIPEMFP